jgi:TatA/E family protein of Tat protein translocase
MLSLPHIVILFVVALVVFGPEKLPELARNLGKFTAEFRRMTGEFKSTFEGHMRDLEREADERRKPPVSTPAAAATPTENTIAAPVAETIAEPTAPSVTPAEGIVRATDPRIPPPEETSEGFPEASPEGIVEASADAHAAESAPNIPGEPQEPVTDGQHHSI